MTVDVNRTDREPCTTKQSMYIGQIQKLVQQSMYIGQTTTTKEQKL